MIPIPDDRRRTDRHVWLNTIRDRPDLTRTDIAVLATLATYMDRFGTEGRPGEVKLAAGARVSERTARRALARAVDLGLLHRAERGHRRGDGRAIASNYTATLPVDNALSTGQPCPEENSLPAKRATSTGHQWPPTQPVTPNQNDSRSQPDTADRKSIGAHPRDDLAARRAVGKAGFRSVRDTLAEVAQHLADDEQERLEG